ncbi:MAG: AAA family ATPase [Candidatus Caldarchaeum sp.]|nr:AAA family ATPase [Candidatus Caldarchaeum sp.]
MAVFQDRDKLSPAYIPSRLLHREREKNLLLSILRPSVEASSDVNIARVQVVGGVGAGKTTLCIKVGQELTSQHRNLTHVYVNLRRFSGGKVSIYRYLVRQAAEEVFSQSLAAEELLDNLLSYLRKTGVKLLITFDEADHHVRQSRGRDTVVYDFTRLQEFSAVRPLNVAGVVFVSRDQSFGGLLERAELSSLGVSVVKLEPYTKTQMEDILADRVEEAFRKGAVSKEILEYVADVACRPPHLGDVRFALDLLLYAGNLAEGRGLSRLEIDDLRYVMAEMGHGLRADDLADLGLDEKAALLSVAKSLKASRKAYTTVEEVEKTYETVRELHSLPVKEIRRALRNLFDKGLVELGDGRVALSGLDAKRLAEFLEKDLKGFSHGSD